MGKMDNGFSNQAEIAINLKETCSISVKTITERK